MSDFQFKFPELFQFFGGYFYQGWATDYRWDGGAPNFAAVVRHFKALNPPSTVNRVEIEIEHLLILDLTEQDFEVALTALGNNYFSDNKNFAYRDWLTEILLILRESAAASKVLRELN